MIMVSPCKFIMHITTKVIAVSHTYCHITPMLEKNQRSFLLFAESFLFSGGDTCLLIL
jgi:hypothetical protein